MYEEVVAPTIEAQFCPAESQRSHWYENVIGCAPVHVPVVAIAARPCTGADETDGSTLLTGAPVAPPDEMSSVAFEAAVADPAAFVAVTRTRKRKPTSLLVTTCEDDVAPVMGVQSAASRRRLTSGSVATHE